MRRQIAEQVVESAQEQNHLIESVRGATLIKVLGLETTRDSQWQNLLIRALNAGLLASKWQSINAAVQVGLQGLQGVIILYLGARSVLSGSGLSIGMLVAFLAYRQIFAERANALNLQLVQFRLLDVHLERLK
ncbi:ABC transporter, partial [Microbacterium sp. AISO3]